jgi:UDP-2,3-diacylglucosamine hydrolase
VSHLFVSDLHLDASTPQANAAFLRFLGDDARSAQSLFVLGDLFETWIGDDDDDPARDAVCRALAALAKTGVDIAVLHGNRDFLYGVQFERRTGAKVLPDPSVVTLCDRRILLCHGDLLCTGDRAYQELRSTARDKPSMRSRNAGSRTVLRSS